MILLLSDIFEEGGRGHLRWVFNVIMVWGVCLRGFGIVIFISWTVLVSEDLYGKLCGGILWASGRSGG